MEPSLSTLTVKELVERYPQAVPVLMNAGLLCVGCPADAFHTLEDVVREYHLDLNTLLGKLRKAIAQTKG